VCAQRDYHVATARVYGSSLKAIDFSGSGSRDLSKLESKNPRAIVEEGFSSSASGRRDLM